jgi:hypothetical protein
VKVESITLMRMLDESPPALQAPANAAAPAPRRMKAMRARLVMIFSSGAGSMGEPNAGDFRKQVSGEPRMTDR